MKEKDKFEWISKQVDMNEEREIWMDIERSRQE